jgi:8-oxo-dGTP pyrophosphatase MutT (NUDIX family)
VLVPPEQPALQRHQVVAVFVVDPDPGTVLLIHHRKLDRWLPPGGHVDEGGLPDDAALREVREETGIDVRLVPDNIGPIHHPQIARPEAIQLERVAPDHEHIDLVYFAVPADDARSAELNARETRGGGWYALPQLDALGVDDEIGAWCALAVRTVRARLGAAD